MALSLSSSSQINANSSKLSQTNDAHTTAASMNGADCRIHIVMQTCIEFYAPAKCVNSQEAQSIPKSSVYHFSMFRIPSSTHNTYLLDSPHHTHTHTHAYTGRERETCQHNWLYIMVYSSSIEHISYFALAVCLRVAATVAADRCANILLYIFCIHTTHRWVYMRF